MVRIVKKSLAKEPEQRYQTGQEMAADLFALTQPGQVPTVRQVHTHDRVTGGEQRQVHRHVRLAAGMRLYVGVLRVEQRLCTITRQVFGRVDKLATTIVALTGVPFGVFVRQHRTDRFEYGRRRVVLAGDQFELGRLALGLTSYNCMDLRISQ